MWTTRDYDGAVVELPPGAWEMPTSMTGKEALRWLRAFGTRLPLAARVLRVMEARHLREPHFYVRIIGVRTARQGQGLGSALMQPTLQRASPPGYRLTSRPVASAALHCTSGSALCTWARLSCRRADRRSDA